MAVAFLSSSPAAHHYSYPSIMSSLSDEGRGSSTNNGQPQYIREEIVFTTPRCNTPGAAAVPRGGGSDINASPADKRASMLQEYFKSTNALTRSIMLEKSTVEHSHGHSWNILSDSKRDEMLNAHFVPAEVREQYGQNGLTKRHHSLNRLTSSPATFLSQDHHYETIQDVDTGLSTLSQPVDSHFLSQRRGTTPPSTDAFSRNKLMSFSMRSKKVSPLNKRKIEPTTEFLPLFERDVHDIDNEVDLPDESLLHDHEEAPNSTNNTEENFTRLRPLRYSFGRKLRHKTDSRAQSSSDLTVISNMNVESPSLQDLRMTSGSSSLDLIDLAHGSSELSMTQSDPHALLASPMSEGDTSSIISSRHSLSTPDSSSHLTRGKSARFHAPEPSAIGYKHPLTRSVRAGSKYVTVTSDMADRRHLFKGQQKRKTKSENNTRENTPVPMEAERKNSIPTIKTDVYTCNTVQNTTELVSPLSSPPASPAAHGPPGSKRESGYISSYGENEASDDEEMPSRSHHSSHKSSKKRHNHFMHSSSASNNRSRHYLH